MQILCPGGADDSEKWAQPPAGRDAQRARCPAAGTAHARTHLSTYLQTLSIKRSMTDRSFLSVLQIRPIIRTPMPGLQLFQVPPATNRPAK